MSSVRNAMSAFPGDSQRTETLQDSSEPIVVIVTCFLSLRSVCHYTCEIHSAFRSQTKTAFVYLFWGVTLKPWSRATHRFSFEWHPDIPIRYRCVTVFLSSFCLVLLSAALFPLFHSPSYTPTYTYTHTHKWERASLELAKHHSGSANHTQAPFSVNSTVPAVWPSSHLHRHLLFFSAASCIMTPCHRYAGNKMPAGTYGIICSKLAEPLKIFCGCLQLTVPS